MPHEKPTPRVLQPYLHDTVRRRSSPGLAERQIEPLTPQRGMVPSFER